VSQADMSSVSSEERLDEARYEKGG
jgi:hypothetical protein